MKTFTFEEFLEDEFMALREIGGMPITKDNHEDLFSSWCENLDAQEYSDLAEKAIQKARIEAKEQMWKEIEPAVENLKGIKSDLEKLQELIGVDPMDMLGKQNER